MNEIRPVITFEQAKKLLDTAPGCIMLDVREEEEYNVEHADGAVLFPVDSIDEDSAARIIPEKSTPVIVYCRSGKRSRMAAHTLTSLGYTDVYDVGSLVGWPYGKV